MSTGKVAYEAYYNAIGGWAQGHHWDMISSDEKRAWRAVEQAALASAESNASQSRPSAADLIRANATTIHEFAGSSSQQIGLIVYLLDLLEKEQPVVSRASERPVLYRGALGVVQLVSSESADPIVYRALGPAQRMPRESFLEVFKRCEPIHVEDQGSAPEREGG